MADYDGAAAIIESHLRGGDDGAAPGDGWQQLPEVITAEELLDAGFTTDRLPWFPRGQSWKTKEEYVKALYLILRFEGSEGLRYSIKCFKQDTGMKDNDDTCIYTKVSLNVLLYIYFMPLTSFIVRCASKDTSSPRWAPLHESPSQPSAQTR